jgi:hypothetical protein
MTCQRSQPEAVLGDLVTLTTRQIRLNGLGSSSRRYWLAGRHLRFDPQHPCDDNVKLPPDRLPCLDRA